MSALGDMQERYEAEARDEFGVLTLDELEAMPTLAQGQAADLKLERDGWRVWLSRCGVEDGMPFDDAVMVERCVNGRWCEVAQWEAER